MTFFRRLVLEHFWLLWLELEIFFPKLKLWQRRLWNEQDLMWLFDIQKFKLNIGQFYGLTVLFCGIKFIPRVWKNWIFSEFFLFDWVMSVSFTNIHSVKLSMKTTHKQKYFLEISLSNCQIVKFYPVDHENQSYFFCMRVIIVN